MDEGMVAGIGFDDIDLDDIDFDKLMCFLYYRLVGDAIDNERLLGACRDYFLWIHKERVEFDTFRDYDKIVEILKVPHALGLIEEKRDTHGRPFYILNTQVLRE